MFLLNRIAKRSPEAFELYLGHVALLQYEAGAERKRIGTEEVNMHGSGLTVACELEVVMLEVRKRMGHVPFAAGDALVPEGGAGALDPHLAMDVVEGGAHDQFRAQRAGTELGAGEV